MLLHLSLKLLRGSPKVIVIMAMLECSEFEWMHSYIVLQGPWQPTVGMCVLYTVAVLCTADWKYEELFCSGAKGECT